MPISESAVALRKSVCHPGNAGLSLPGGNGIDAEDSAEVESSEH
jgi:hypothetical protein